MSASKRLRHLLTGHECRTARYSGLAGMKNGELLAAAETAGFEIIVTVDQNLPAQQNLSRYRIALVILCAATNRLRDLERLVPAALRALGSIQPGEVVKIG